MESVIVMADTCVLVVEVTTVFNYPQMCVGIYIWRGNNICISM